MYASPNIKLLHKLWEVYWFYSLSVDPSVCLSCMPHPLCGLLLISWIIFICAIKFSLGRPALTWKISSLWNLVWFYLPRDKFKWASPNFSHQGRATGWPLDLNTAGLLSIVPSGTYFSQILIKIQQFSLKKQNLKKLFQTGSHFSWPQCVNSLMPGNSIQPCMLQLTPVKLTLFSQGIIYQSTWSSWDSFWLYGC